MTGVEMEGIMYANRSSLPLGIRPIPFTAALMVNGAASSNGLFPRAGPDPERQGAGSARNLFVPPPPPPPAPIDDIKPKDVPTANRHPQPVTPDPIVDTHTKTQIAGTTIVPFDPPPVTGPMEGTGTKLVETPPLPR